MAEFGTVYRYGTELEELPRPKLEYAGSLQDDWPIFFVVPSTKV